MEKQRGKKTYTQAQNKATQKYIKKVYDEYTLRTPKGKKIVIKEHAAKQNESVNGFINRAVDETMERDNNDSKAGDEE